MRMGDEDRSFAGWEIVEGTYPSDLSSSTVMTAAETEEVEVFDSTSCFGRIREMKKDGKWCRRKGELVV